MVKPESIWDDVPEWLSSFRCVEAVGLGLASMFISDAPFGFMCAPAKTKTQQIHIPFHKKISCTMVLCVSGQWHFQPRLERLVIYVHLFGYIYICMGASPYGHKDSHPSTYAVSVWWLYLMYIHTPTFSVYGHYIYIYTYIYIYIYTYIHIYIFTFIHRYIYTYIHRYIYTYIHRYIYTYIHIYTYTYIHIYIYIYIYIST